MTKSPRFAIPFTQALWNRDDLLCYPEHFLPCFESKHYGSVFEQDTANTYPRRFCHRFTKRSFVWLFQVIEALILAQFFDEGIVKMAAENQKNVVKFLITLLNSVIAIGGLNIY